MSAKGKHTIVMSQTAYYDHAVAGFRLFALLDSCNVFLPWLFLLLNSRVAFGGDIAKETFGCLELEV